MATADQALANVRKICLALPDTSERDYFGSAGFYVKGKLFATCGGKHGVCEIVFGLQPDHAAALLAGDARFTPYARDRRAVVIDAASVRSLRELEPLLREGYELRAPAKKQGRASAPKRARR